MLEMPEIEAPAPAPFPSQSGNGEAARLKLLEEQLAALLMSAVC